MELDRSSLQESSRLLDDDAGISIKFRVRERCLVKPILIDDLGYEGRDKRDESSQFSGVLSDSTPPLTPVWEEKHRGRTGLATRVR